MNRFKNRLFEFSLMVLIGSIVSTCQTETTPTKSASYAKAVNASMEAENSLISFRHDLHRNPEISGQEFRTSVKVVTELERLGFEVRKNVGGYGVVGTLEGKRSGPVIAFRADMDATAQVANDPVPYASEVEGVYHICGHDMHTTIGIGLATAFSAIRDDIDGTIMLIFQPEEEAGTGANDMLADGIFSEIEPDAILAVHTAPFEIGELHVKPFEMMAGRAAIDVELSGNGDLIEAAKQVRSTLLDLATVRPPETYSFGPQRFIHVDIFPVSEESAKEKMTVSGFVMNAEIDQRENIESQVLQALENLSFDEITLAISYQQALEGVYNDPAVLEIANHGISTLASNVEVLPISGIIPVFSEDFGSFQKQTPGSMYFLGVNNSEKGTVGYPHSPDYVADDAAIQIGVSAMLAAMLELTSDDFYRESQIEAE